MTRRERMERRLEKRTEWAEKREASAQATFDQAHTMADAIPFGQPIIAGHHSERRDRNYRARIDAAMGRGVTDSRMAEHHANRAQGIARQLDTSVFSDDEDAIERLRERIAEREARRDRIKAFNASCRKGTPNPSLLTERERDELAGTRRVAAYQLSKGGGFPNYALTNLGATIRKDKERIADIERRAKRTADAKDNGGAAVQVIGDYCTITFAEKPEREILNALKAAGFHWGAGSWHGQIASLSEVVCDSQTQEFVDVFGAIRAAIES
jgi:hypothetical protein